MTKETGFSKSDTIEVRPDERFDEGRLAEYLRGKLDGAELPMRVRQFGGGQANLTYLLQFNGAEYVLRRPPLGPVAPSSHDMAREHKVLSVLHQAYPLAPRAFLLCGDPAVIGAPFFVMERRRGIVVRKKMPPQFEPFPDAPRKLSMALADCLADLHAVDYAKLGLADLGKPEGFIERQVEGWRRRWLQAETEDLPEMDQVYDWLSRHIPPLPGRSLVHNDFKLDNVMFSAADPARPTAVFDWDMCTLGDPLSDLGAVLAYWSEPADPPHFKAMAMMPNRGFPTRREVAERYAEKSGRSLAELRFYHALGLFRLTVIVAQIHVRFRRGQTQDARFAALGPMLPLVARAAWDVASGNVSL